MGFVCRPGELLFEEMCVSGRGRTKRRRAGGRSKHEDELYIQNKVKFVINSNIVMFEILISKKISIFNMG